MEFLLGDNVALDVNATYDNGSSALNVAADQAHVKCVEALITAGADLNHQRLAKLLVHRASVVYLLSVQIIKEIGRCNFFVQLLHQRTFRRGEGSIKCWVRREYCKK